MKEFEIHVAEADLADLQRRLAAFRSAPPPASEPWESGVDDRYLLQLIDDWRTRFDWRRQEERLNAHPQFLASVNGQAVHFVHARADRARYPHAVPIILSHGWPYSFVEFLPITPLLADPLAHGGREEDAFDVVIPSLPGYLFSAKLSDTPFTGETVAHLWHSLMTDALGYQRYATYGEDIGTTISDWLGALYPEAIIGLFATHAAFPPPERSADLSPAEQRFVDWLADEWRTGRGYSAIQSTRPDTLAVALTDSPVGLLAWMVEKFREWSGPEFEQSWSLDDILTTTSLYWFTSTIGTSFLPYYHGSREPTLPMVSVPVGVSVQWREHGFPQQYAERTYTDVRVWRELPSGGHFTAKQSPDLVAADLRAFFASLR